ncbi:MAG: glucose-1-phosphate adenylyltransferase [Planctomycetes bacterium]|nr:glucose-1-phosphate adenylyltransferase [Planctomycetota bacterium]
MQTLSLLKSSLAVILAGGEGQRLYPLTRDRAKPAVPFGGVYRIIDFTLSNCLNSGIRRLIVLTQYKSLSLNRHLYRGWNLFNPELDEFMEVIPPQQRAGSSWYSGTADAIFQNIYTLDKIRPERVVILSGDHIYRMDYLDMLDTHESAGADLTISFLEVPKTEAARFGVARIDRDNRVIDFVEKSPDPPEIPDKPGWCLASMGIYVFGTEILVRRVSEDARKATAHDFGKDIIPGMVQRGDRVFAHRFHGVGNESSSSPYWRDIGLIDAYYTANMDLVDVVPALDLYNRDWPIRTYHGQVPPAKVVRGTSGGEGQILSSLMANGCLVSGGTVRHSILAHSVRIGDSADVQDSILMEKVQVGPAARVHNAILDKGVQIPAGIDLDDSRGRFPVTDGGIIVVPKDTPEEVFLGK